MEDFEFEETTRFSDEELASVALQIRERLAMGELEPEGPTEMVTLDVEDLEPLDSEVASFSLDVPPWKEIEAQVARMPHEPDTDEATFSMVWTMGSLFVGSMLAGAVAALLLL